MDEPSDRVVELTGQASALRLRAIEANERLVAEFQEIWRELNQLAALRPEARKVCDHIAADIARLEKLDLAFDTERLDEAKRSRQ